MRYVVIASVMALAPLALAQQPAATGPSAATEPAATTQLAPPAVPVATAPSPAAPESRPAPASIEQQLAAASLRHDTRSLISSSAQTPARGGRIVLLSEYAYRLDPANPEVNMLLANIHENNHLFADARKAIERQLVDTPQDYSLALSYLRVGLAGLATAEQRLAFLQQVADRSELDASARATALTMAGQILLGQNDKKGALAKFQQALSLDGRLPEALRGQLSAQENVPEIQKLAALLKEVEGSPASASFIWDAGLTLQHLGGHQQAITFFEDAWELMSRQDSLAEAPASRAAEYFNAMLDAGLARRAIETFVPMAQKYKSELAFQSLLVEAYRAIGDDDRATALSRQVIDNLESTLPSSSKQQQYNEAMAWYYLVTDPKPNLALTFAQKAFDAVDEPSQSLQLAMAAARLRSGQKVDEAIKTLTALADKDALADFFLAEYYFRQPAGVEDGKKFLSSGLKVARSGQPYRLLTALAKRQGVAVEPNPDAKAITDTLAGFNQDYLLMGLSPQRYIEVSIKPVNAEVGLAAPVEVEATLTNISNLQVPVGPLGLLNPVMSFKVVAAGGKSEEFTDLPMATWSTPRYIKPGQAVKATVRMDVGPLERHLLVHPLDTMTLTVSGTVDPVQRGASMTSALPTMDVGPAKITRSDILGQFDRTQADWGPQYQRGLGYIVKDIKRGDLPARMRAAREVGGLLTFVSDIDSGAALPPKQLTGKVTQPVLLAMLSAIVKDSEPDVRAEALAGLKYLRPNTDLVTVLTPLLSDKDPLVQFRAAEFLGATRPNGWSNLIKPFGSSPDKFVREMANLFIAK